jgi:hypothetical protein
MGGQRQTPLHPRGETKRKEGANEKRIGVMMRSSGTTPHCAPMFVKPDRLHKPL